MNPRFAMLASDIFLGGRLGVMVSAAYTIRNTLENGWSTVRWMNDGTEDDGTGTSTSQQFNSVMGYTSGDEYDTVNAAYHPRFPRYDVVTNHAKRLGLTGSIQWQPDDDTLITVDGLFADYMVVRTENYLEANSFSLSQGWSNLVTYVDYSTGTSTKTTSTSTQTGGVQAIDVTDYTLNTNTNNLTSLTANNVGLKTEDFLAHIDSRFMQMTVDGTHNFSEKWKVHALLGWSESHLRNPIQTTMTYDYANPGAQGYSYTYLSSAVSETTVRQTYHDFLPAANMVFEPSDDFLIRLNAAYAMARPGLTNMVPGGTVSVSGSNRTAKVGNPNLKPYRSKNVDLSFEWYYSKGAMLSIAGFYKHIDSLVQSVKSYSTFENNSLGLPDSMAIAACGSSYGDGCNEYDTIWTFSTSKNTKGAPLFGSEINWQQQFDFLPAPFDNMGFLGNVTFVQATQTYYNSDGSVYAKADLTGLSRTSYNTTLYYDDQVFQIRASVAFRSKYIAGMNPGNLNDARYTDGTLNLDLSASYKFDENFQVSFEGVNLTNQAQNQYVDSDGKRPYVWHQTGREFMLGFRYNF